MINTDPQGHNEIAPAKYRIVEIEIPQYVLIFVFIKFMYFRVKVSYFRFERFKRDRFTRVIARRPQEANPMWKFRIAIQIFDFNFIGTIAAQATVPSVQLP